MEPSLETPAQQQPQFHSTHAGPTQHGGVRTPRPLPPSKTNGHVLALLPSRSGAFPVDQMRRLCGAQRWLRKHRAAEGSSSRRHPRPTTAGGASFDDMALYRAPHLETLDISVIVTTKLPSAVVEEAARVLGKVGHSKVEVTRADRQKPPQAQPDGCEYQVLTMSYEEQRHPSLHTMLTTGIDHENGHDAPFLALLSEWHLIDNGELTSEYDRHLASVRREFQKHHQDHVTSTNHNISNTTNATHDSGSEVGLDSSGLDDPVDGDAAVERLGRAAVLFFDRLLRRFDAPAVGAVQATDATTAPRAAVNLTEIDRVEFLPTKPPSRTEDATIALSGALILDRGMEVRFGSSHGDFAPFFVRRGSGFPVTSTRGANETDASNGIVAVSPHATVLRRAALGAVSGFRQIDVPLIDRILNGAVNLDSARKSIDLLRYRIVLLEKAMESITLNEVHAAGSAFRHQVRTSYAVIVDASNAWETATGRSLDAAATQATGSDLEKQEDEEVKATAGMTTEDRLRFLTGRLVDASHNVAPSGKLFDSSVPEESFMWDCSLRLLGRGYQLRVAPDTFTVFENELVPAAVSHFYSDLKYDLNAVSCAVSPAFGDQWALPMRALHPAYQKRKLAIRVVWHSLCCGCCGFSTEIAHLVFPLQATQALQTTLGNDCFCSGFPESYVDSFARMFTTIENFMLQTAGRTDPIVWVSHTDPMSYRQEFMNVRKPEYLIGRSMYEFSRIGQDWVNAAKMADEIWVPAEFVRKVFADSGVPQEKLVIIPEAVDVHWWDPQRLSRLKLPLVGKQRERWVHRCNFQYNDTEQAQFTGPRFFSNFKWEPRKGWEFLFQAYHATFGGATDTPPRHQRPILYIQSYIYLAGKKGDIHNVTFIMEDIRLFARDTLHVTVEELPPFCIITEMLTENEVGALYNSIDVFLFPTRGEGWGLPAIQAMALGKPTIGTNWGGVLGFMTRETSFLIHCDAVEEVPTDVVYGYQTAKKWATPSWTHLAQLMKYVVENPKHAMVVGARARADVIARFSEEAVAAVIDRRLDTIRGLLTARKRNTGKYS